MTTQTLSKRDAWITAWSRPETRTTCVGEGLVACMLVLLEPPPGSTFADFGCGAGRAARRLANLNYSCIGVDWAPNCRDDELELDDAGHGIPLLVADLANLPRVRYADFGYCCDTLTHDMPYTVLAGIARTTRRGAFLAIDCKQGAMLPVWQRAVARYWTISTCTAFGDYAVFACREPIHGADRIS